MLRLLKGLQLTRDVADQIAKEATRLIQHKAETALARRRTLEEKQARLVSTEGKLTEVFLAGHLSSAVYQQKAFELRSQRAQHDRDIQATTSSEAALQDKVKKSLEFLTSIYDVYEQLDDWRRTELLKAVFTGIVLGADGLVGYSLKKQFENLQECQSASTRAQAILEAA